MLRGIRKLINIRLFTSSKEPQSLKDQFKKMASQQTTKTEEKETVDNIKLTDHQKATEDLKSKFDVFRSDLSKNTGQAKSVLEKLYETAKTIKVEDIKSQFKFQKVKNEEKPVENTEKKEENTSKLEENQEKVSKASASADPTPQADQKEIPDPNPQQAKNPKESTSYYKAFSEKFPRTSFYTDKTGKFVNELWKQTFPSQDEKVEKLIKIYEIRKLSKEIDEKLARGEMTEEEIPDWKRTALAKIEPKKSTWKKLQEKLGGGIVSEKASSILQSDSLKQVKSKFKEIKDGVSDVKNLVNEAIEESDSKVLHSAKELVRESILETSEAKATRLMQMYDPDFNIYAMETEMEDHIRNLFKGLFMRDKEFLKGILGGQAKDFFEALLKKYETQGSSDELKGDVVYVSRINYLGSNCDDKNEPRITYGFKMAFKIMINSLIGEENEKNFEKFIEENKNIKSGSLKNINLFSNSSECNIFEIKSDYIVTIVPHEDPNILLNRHPWKFVVFFPSEKADRIAGR